MRLHHKCCPSNTTNMNIIIIIDNIKLEDEEPIISSIGFKEMKYEHHQRRMIKLGVSGH